MLDCRVEMNRFGAIGAFVLVIACSTHLSSIRRHGPNATLYVVDDEARVFRAAFGAMTDVFQHTPVIDIDGPVRGFRVWRTFGADSYQTMIRVFAANGSSESGEPVAGYYFEVTGKGTFFEGPSDDRRVFAEVDRRLRAIGRVVQVTAVERAEYTFDRDRWRLRPPPQEDTGRKPSAEKRFEALEELKRKGLVTPEEYETKRKSILDDL